MNSRLKPLYAVGNLDAANAQTEAAPSACQSSIDHDLDNVIRKGRATWHCAKCGADVSLAYLLYQTALEGLE